MRVLHTLWSAGFGGIERLVLDLGRAETNLGIQVGVLFATEGGEFLDAFRTSPIEIYCAEIRHGWDLSKDAQRRVKRIMCGYDIIHMHSFNPLTAMCAIQSGKTVVFTDHGIYGLGRRTSIRDRIKRLLQRRFLNKHTDYITFNSRFTRSNARSRFGLAHAPQEVVYNGIDLHRGEPRKADLPDTIRTRVDADFVVGTTARFAAVKRIDLLLTAFAAFQQCKDNVVLLLVGDGSLRDEYMRLATKLGIERRLIMAGYQSNVAAFQNAMDVCVFPSEQESFGLVAVESLSLGKPTVVMRDGGGIAEVVGALDPSDVVSGIDGLIDRLNFYYRNHGQPNDCEDTKRLARISHAHRFDIHAMANRMCEIYDQLLSDPSPSQPTRPTIAAK